MPEPVHVNLVVGGEMKSGSFEPDVEGSVEITIPNGIGTKIAVEHTPDNALKVRIDGEFSVDLGGGKLNMEGGGSIDAINGGASVTGSIEWVMNDRVSLKATTNYDFKDGFAGSGTVTFQF